MKVLFALSAIFLLSLKTGDDPKYVVSLTAPQWDDQVFNKITSVEQSLDSTNIPHQQYKSITSRLEEIRFTLLAPLNQQAAAAKAEQQKEAAIKAHADSLAKGLIKK